MYAFMKSGVYGDYDCVDEFDVIAYVESLPLKHEPVTDIESFKKFSAQYFTPSDLKDGLARNRSNISNIHGLTFDLDRVPEYQELVHEFLTVLTKSKIEMYLWKTPSAIYSDSDHENGARLFIPLGAPIHPDHLSDAIREVFLCLCNAGLNMLNYGYDVEASKTVGRLMGLPLQQEDTIVPWDMPDRKRYKIQTEYIPKPKNIFKGGGFGNFEEEPNVDNLASFITSYTSKHGIGFAKGERDNNLTRVFGALKTAFNGIDESDLLSAFEQSGIAQLLDNPAQDITRKARRLLR